MTAILKTVLVSALSLGFMRQDGAEPFQPFQPRANPLVNGVAFDGSDSTMIFALLNREVLAHRGRADSTASETAIFSARRTPNG